MLDFCAQSPRRPWSRSCWSTNPQNIQGRNLDPPPRPRAPPYIRIAFVSRLTQKCASSENAYKFVQRNATRVARRRPNVPDPAETRRRREESLNDRRDREQFSTSAITSTSSIRRPSSGACSGPHPESGASPRLEGWPHALIVRTGAKERRLTMRFGRLASSSKVLKGMGSIIAVSLRHAIISALLRAEHPLLTVLGVAGESRLWARRSSIRSRGALIRRSPSPPGASDAANCCENCGHFAVLPWARLSSARTSRHQRSTCLLAALYAASASRRGRGGRGDRPSQSTVHPDRRLKKA